MKTMHLIICVHPIDPVPHKAVACTVMCYAKRYILFSCVTEELKTSIQSVYCKTTRKQFRIHRCGGYFFAR